MRDDEDNIRQYMPVLRRIIILLAVLTAIPVVMWTLTAVVRTYVGLPKAPNYQSMAPRAPDSSATEQAAAVPPGNLTTASLPVTPPADSNTTATDPANTAAGPDQTKALALVGNAPNPMPLDAMPQSPGPAAAETPQPAALAVSSAIPNSAPTPDQTPDTTQAASQQPVAPAQQQVADQQPDAANWPAPPPAAADAPQDSPIAGPVPLPRRRPPTVVLAESGIPLPTPRPDAAGTVAPAPAPTPLDWLHHIFQQPAGADSPPVSDH